MEEMISETNDLWNTFLLLFAYSFIYGLFCFCLKIDNRNSLGRKWLFMAQNVEFDYWQRPVYFCSLPYPAHPAGLLWLRCVSAVVKRPNVEMVLPSSHGVAWAWGRFTAVCLIGSYWHCVQKQIELFFAFYFLAVLYFVAVIFLFLGVLIPQFLFVHIILNYSPELHIDLTIFQWVLITLPFIFI